MLPQPLDIWKHMLNLVYTNKIKEKELYLHDFMVLFLASVWISMILFVLAIVICRTLLNSTILFQFKWPRPSLRVTG